LTHDLAQLRIADLLDLGVWRLGSVLARFVEA
jgi:hypothetical protein